MVHAVIMAGGIGARFWPMSRRKKPKQMLDLLGEGTLMDQTIARIEQLVLPEHRWVITNREQMQVMVEEKFPLPQDQYLIEPMGKNTAPAIGLSAIHLLRRDPDAVMIVLPADHRIANLPAFHECLETAIELVKDSEILATIGIEPTRAETGYGYIQMDQAKALAPNAYWVKTFAEKPNPATAKLFFESHEFLWNSGIFIWRADVILRQISEHLPQWHSGLQKISSAIGTPQEEEITRQVFHALKSISIDYGVMERAPRVAVVKGDFGWSDVGSWDELWRLLPQDADQNACRGNALPVETKNSLILAKDKLIALVGIENLLVVDVGDAILICPREQSQRVRAIVDKLEKSGGEKYL